MFRSIAIAGLAGGLLTLGAAPADAGCCCGTSYAPSHSGYSVQNATYSGQPSYDSGYRSNYYSGLNYGVRTTNPYAYDPIRRRAGVSYGAFYGNRSGYGYRPSYDYGRGGYRSPYYQRGGYVIPSSARGGYGSRYYRSGGFGPTRGYGGYGYGPGYGYGSGISIGIGR